VASRQSIVEIRVYISPGQGTGVRCCVKTASSCCRVHSLGGRRGGESLERWRFPTLTGRRVYRPLASSLCCKTRLGLVDEL
jgi:hypothetical protein